MFRLKDLDILGSVAELATLPKGKLLINTINAHSFNTAKKDKLFAEALTNGDRASGFLGGSHRIFGNYHYRFDDSDFDQRDRNS